MIAVLRKAAIILGDGEGTPNFTALAQAIGCHRSSLYLWKKVPIRYHNKIIKVTGGKITSKQLMAEEK